MSVRFGLGIGTEHVRLVVARRGAILWAGEEELSAHDALGDAIAALLRAVEGATPRRARMTVAVGPRAAQVREVTGLPPVRDVRLLLGMVAEDRGRFFVGNASSLRVVGVTPLSSGGHLAAAIDEGVLVEILGATRDLGLRRMRFAPTLALLPYIAPLARLSWHDGVLVSDMTIESGELQGAQTAFSPSPLEAGLSSSVGQVDLSDWPLPRARFADALAAVLSPRDLRFVVDASALIAPSTRARARRLAGPVGASLLGGALFISAPVKDQWDVSRFTATLEAIDPKQWALADSVTTRLEEVTAVLERANDLVSGRILVTELLATITYALPTECALAAAVIDHDEVRLSILAPRLQDLLPILQALPGLSEVSVMGDPLLVTIAGREIERGVVRFLVDARSFRVAGPPQDLPR
jgi:hypothetical protein